jgi:metal-responsive CopG/Arc/MetJ family transcriptional regulator
VTGLAIPVATVRLPPELLLALDALASEQKPTASRSDVIRRILAEHLKARGYLRNAPSDQGLRPDQLNAENDG